MAESPRMIDKTQEPTEEEIMRFIGYVTALEYLYKAGHLLDK